MKEDVDTNSASDLSAVVGALLNALDDKYEDVKQAIMESIQKIAKKDPLVVIHTSLYFRELHQKLSPSHVGSVLDVMTETCRDQAVRLDADLASTVAELAVNELTTGNAKEKACELLITLSKVHCTQAMGALLTKFEPGVKPYYRIIYAMGMLAVGNVRGMMPFIKVTISIMLPMLSHVREERLKQAFCYTLGKFAEAINDYIMNADETSDPGISKDTFKTEIALAFDILTSNWLHSHRDSKLIERVLKALGPMLLLLPEDPERRRTTKLTPIILHYCKKSSTRLAATRVLAVLLSCAIEEDKEILRPYLEQMHQILSELISIAPFEASRETLLTHYEVLRCYQVLVVLYPNEGLDLVLQQLKSITNMQRSRALMVLRHLINTLPAKDDAVLQRIALNLQDSLGESSVRQIVGAIATLVAKSTFSLSTSQRAAFVQFMVIHCEPGKDESEACEEALNLLATTVEGAESWLWPLLLNSLLDPDCITSVVPVARAMSVLAVKIIRDQECAAFREEFESIKVLGQCLELLNSKINRAAVVTFLRCSAPLFGQHLKELWDKSLSELLSILEDERIDNSITVSQRVLIWEEKIVELLEESVKLEGEAWGLELADELAERLSESLRPEIAPLLAAVSTKIDHTALLIESAHNRGTSGEFSRAVGICGRRHPGAVLKLMEDSCIMEDSRKLPVKLLGLVKDSKAAATAEAAKAGLLRAYAEIARRAESAYVFSTFDKHVLPWIIRQLNDCKELSTKEAGLLALEQIGGLAHPNRLADSTGLRARSSALATLLTLLQTPSGHRSLQLYSSIFRATISLLEIPPTLNPDERNILLRTMLDKVLPASAEISMLLRNEKQQVREGLGLVCSKVVSDSADALAEFVDVVLPWIQSKSYSERKATLLLLRDTLRSYHDSLKYTYPGGKLEPGKLLGKILPLCADSEPTLRSFVIDCTCHLLNIGSRHLLRSTSPNSNLDQNLNELKEKIISEDSNIFYEAVENVAAIVSEKVVGGEVVGLAEGLIESLLFHDECSIAAGIALTQLFNIRGTDLPHAVVYLIDKIVVQMRKMDNVTCRHRAATAVKSLMTHHSQEVIESLLKQPSLLDRGTEECWKEVGTSEELGLQALELLLVRLESNNLFDENQLHPDKNNPVALSSLAAIIAMGHLLQSSKSDIFIEKQLAKLLSTLLTYLAGWSYIATSTSTAIAKFGFISNTEMCKLNPYKEVYSVLINVLIVVDLNVASSLPNETIFNSELEAEESLISTVSSTVRCLLKRNDVLSNLSHFLGKLAASAVPAQRAVSAAFYTELIGRVDCGVIWLDAIINSLHEAKTDSSPLVRKLAIVGLARIAYLEYDQMEEYLDNCIAALLDGLEEPASGDGGNEVALESLRGLSILLSVQGEKPLSPSIVLALKPFIEKESWEMRLAAINSLGAIARGWQKSVVTQNDDITNHLLGCLSCLVVRLEDLNLAVAVAVKETLYDSASLLQCESLNLLMRNHMDADNILNVENYLRELICCLQRELPQTAEDLRNAVSRGYSRSENSVTRATSALILGLYGQPRSEDVQRLLQLLHDEASNVRARTARALSLCFTVIV